MYVVEDGDEEKGVKAKCTKEISLPVYAIVVIVSISVIGIVLTGVIVHFAVSSLVN